MSHRSPVVRRIVPALVRVSVVASLLVVLAPRTLHAQTAAPEADTRAGVIAAQQAAKALTVRPPRPGTAETLVRKIDEHLNSGHLRWHPYFGTAYPGAGVTLGAGYLWSLGNYDSLDVRASVSVRQSKRVEAEYRMPRLFRRRGAVSVLGGWKDGRDMAFFGIGSAGTAADDRVRFDFRQSYGAANLLLRPTRGPLVLTSGLELSRYEQQAPSGSAIAARFQPTLLPGLGATVDYAQSHGGLAFDWRPASGYARRGGAYGVTARRYDARSGAFSFRQLEYDVVQHVPLLRDAWVLSVHGRVETTDTSDGDTVPFFMLPSLGNGTTLRGFSSYRFRDRHSLLLSAEWRVLLNSVMDASVFYDAGKVTARRRDLDLHALKSNYGVGFRLHTPTATPLRVDLARSNEGLVLVFTTTAAF